MALANRDTRLAAVAPAAESSDARTFGIDLSVRPDKPPALHNRIGWIDFGPGGSSYYYSRTAMGATGTVTLGDETLKVTGTAWFDHQWGDFIAVGGGGWDWFAVNLDDGTDITLSLVRDADGSYPLVYGTLVAADGTTRHLPREAFTVVVTGGWTSPTTGASYPAGWRVTIPGDDLTIDLRPTVAGQELDTRATTGVVYWEGSQVVSARRGETALSGEAYVELTGYAAAGAAGPSGAPLGTPSTAPSPPGG
jgi:predicted secreted hydrolase